MSQINFLTKEQEQKLSIYRDKWLKIGLCTDRVDRIVAKEISDYYYKNISQKPIVPVVVLSSPLYAWVAVCLMSQVRSQVWSQVRSQVESQVWSQVRSQVESQVESQVWLQVGSQVGSFIYPYLAGHFMASYFSYFNFINEILNIKFECQEKYDWYQKTSQVGLIYPLENICIISDRPEEVKIKNGLLHSDDGPSIKYTDGFCIYSLNGVRVTKELVETSADQLNPDLVVKETNAEVRREIVRKIGVDRIYQKLGGKTLDKQGDVYELITLDLKDGRTRPYLKMRNPSIGVFHIEGVPQEIKTVEEAINWRNGTIERPVVLT